MRALAQDLDRSGIRTKQRQLAKGHNPVRKAAGGSNLSPPNVEATNESAVAVYVDAFVPHATVTVSLNGSTVIGGPVAPGFGFAAISLTHALHTGDKVTATQTVNGVRAMMRARLLRAS